MFQSPKMVSYQVPDLQKAKDWHSGILNKGPVFDYMVQAPDMASRYGVKMVLEAWQKTYSSEHAQFGIEEGSIEMFLSQRGYRLLESLTPEQIEKRFLTLRDGSLAGRVLALFNLAHASVV